MTSPTPKASSGLLASLALAVILLAIPAPAQGRGGGGPGGPGRGGMDGPGASGGNGPSGGGMPRGTFGGGLSIPNNSRPPNPSQSGGNDNSITHGGLQLGPPGRWWDDRRFAQNIGLDSAQQRRMDDIFSANKGNLVKLYKNLQHEESQLEKVTRSRELNEAQIFNQIDRVAQARGELEKASAHYLLQIRKEMTIEQTSRLDDHGPSQGGDR